MEYNARSHEEFFPPVKEFVPGEVLTPTQKRIRHLRGVFESRHLTVPQVSDMINDKVASSTLYRFFEKDSELKYRFTTYTIDVIQMALLVGDTLDIGDASAKEKVASYEAALQEKDDAISDLRRQLEQQRIEFDRKCADYETRLSLWQQQIIKKDERMDRKDYIIEQQDAEIHQLRARIDELTSKLL